MSSEPVLKVWALDKPVKKTGLPTCLSTIQINNGKKRKPWSEEDEQRFVKQLEEELDKVYTFQGDRTYVRLVSIFGWGHPGEVSGGATSRKFFVFYKSRAGLANEGIFDRGNF